MANNISSINTTPGSGEKTEVEQAILKLKNSIQDFIHEEKIYNDYFYLLRWVIAANMDLKKAEKCLRTTATWRREYDVPSLLEADFPDGIMESLPIYIDALTADGILVGSVDAGLIDFRGLLYKYGRKAGVRYLMQAFVQAESILVDISKKYFEGKSLTPESVQGVLGIVDADKFEARQLRTIEGIQAVIEICTNFVKYFPYLCTRIIVINCNSVSRIALKIIRPIMEGQNLKFDVYGQDRSEWQGVISSLIPPHLLRERFGGTRAKKDEIPRTKFFDRDYLLSLL